jgi:hypothetical protein
MSDVDLPEDESQEPEAEAEAAPRQKRAYKRRHDVAAVAPKKGRRKPQARFDSEPSPAIDGYGDPLAVQMARGWTYCWVTPRDGNRWRSRRWEDGRHGDKRILGYLAPADAKGGAIIASEQGSMTLKIWRVEDCQAWHANDYNRKLHANNKAEERNRRIDAVRLNNLNL